jgi:hypothetical protein
MRWAGYIAYTRDINRLLLGNRKGIDHLENTVVERFSRWETVLKGVLKKQVGRLWTGSFGPGYGPVKSERRSAPQG